MLEVQEVSPGVGVVVQDLLSEEIFEVNDISASYSVSRWVLGLLRLIRTAGRVSFTGSAMVLSPGEKAGVLETAQELWAQYRAECPDASLSDFYRDNSLALHLAIKRAQEEASRLPIPLTAEGHSLVLATARYRIRGDAHQVEAVLDDSEEFVHVGPSDEHPGALHYNWLQRGRSHVPQAEKKPERRALLLRTEWNEDPGKPSYLNLGDLSLGEKWLELECMSRERLQAGKSLLESIFGKQIVHQADRFEDWESEEPGDARPARPRGKPIHDDEELETLTEEILRRLTLDWLDQVAIKGELTPRQAAQTPEGRKDVIEVLKQVEYINDQRTRHGGKPTMDLDLIRKELGLEG